MKLELIGQLLPHTTLLALCNQINLLSPSIALHTSETSESGPVSNHGGWTATTSWGDDATKTIWGHKKLNINSEKHCYGVAILCISANLLVFFSNKERIRATRMTNIMLFGSTKADNWIPWLYTKAILWYQNKNVGNAVMMIR